MTRLMILVGSVRPGRIGLPIAEWVRRTVEADGRFEPDWADLAEIALPLLDEPNHPRLRKYTKPHTVAWSERVAAADAFVFVTPEYNHSFAPSVKNAIDYLNAEWRRKPVGLVSYGGVSGGTRGAAALRIVLNAVGLVNASPAVELPFAAQQLADGGFEPRPSQQESLGLMLDDLVALDAALSPLRA